MIQLFVAVTVVAHALAASAADDLKDRLATARPGETVVLPAGEFQGGVTVPEGVSLQGAGFGETILTGGGLTVEGGRGAVISDLSVHGAGIVVNDAESVTVARVRTTGTATGLLLHGVTAGRIENCVSDRNNRGIAVSGGEGCIVVNCTIANCPDVGLSLANCPGTVVFNNGIVGSATCLSIDRPDDLHVDHNLYFGIYAGQMKGQLPRRMLTAWNHLTGLDGRSVRMAVEFDEDFTPTTVLSWSLDRVATAAWGATEFAGVQAPASDLLGQRRAPRPGVGAVEADIQPPREADGDFTVTSVAGLKSAGVFTKDGFLVAYLFQNLPLPAGRHAFWLPPRDFLNRPIAAGDYEVRVAESDFRWTYLNHIGDNGEVGSLSHSASHNPQFSAFAPGGLLVVQEGPSEDHTGLRAYDVETGQLRWWVSGSSGAQGVAVGPDGMIYFVRETNSAAGESRLTRVDGATGEIIPWPDSKVGHIAATTAPGAKSLAILGDRLYLAAAQANKLFVISTADGRVEGMLDVPAPRSVAGDETSGLLWVVSGSALVALKPDGTPIAQSSAVPEPLAVAARDGQIAVASSQTGQIHFFDASDPANLNPVRDFGTGDGPYGAFSPERFWFQKAPRRQREDDLVAGIALGASGQFAVIDQRRVLLFDAAGANRWHTIGIFGNQSQPSFSTHNRRFWDSSCELSFLLDETDGSWTTEGLWDQQSLLPDAEGQIYMPLGDFADGGHTFLVTVSGPFGRNPAKPPLPLLVVSRLEGFRAVPMLIVTEENGTAVQREDTNADGRITADDRAQPLLGADGAPLPTPLFHRFNYLLPDGSLLAMAATPMVWRRTGLSATGVPVYEGKDYASLLAADWTTEVSPYDLQPDGTRFYGSVGFVAAGMLSDGGSVVQVPLRGSGGTGLNNGAGTDLVGFGTDGRRRWVHQLAEHKGIAGLGTVDDITLTSVFYSCETIAVDADGLGLGGFCEPRHLNYAGYWIDHPNLRLFKLPDGGVYATWGDNADGRHPWFRLDNQQSLTRTKHDFRLGEDRAGQLAALEAAPAAVNRVPQPEVRIPRLAQPWAIDGDLEKWRQAGVQPIAVIGPQGSFNGPRDCSTVVRMAYEGQNLYFQVLQFDDVPTFYAMVYEDCVELAINGACGPGFQFICYKDADGTDHVWRNRFFQGGSQRFIDPQHAPRIVKVLPDARDVPERRLVETLYGEDLSESKVVLTEFKLPIDAVTFAGAEQDVFSLGPGTSFSIGFFIDDSDTPYTDVQRLLQWPATFGMFNPPEDGARAICE
jgi:parallel beta-helix repeat protein